MAFEINLKIFLLGIIFFLLNKFEIYIIFIFSIVFHEFAHLLVGICEGFKPQKFTLNPFGVSLRFYSYGSKKISKKIWTYLAGPILNFLIAFLVYYINIEVNLKEKIIYTNLLLGIFNLIPLNTLDGGRILKELLTKIYGVKMANLFMIKISKTLLIILTLLYSVAILKIKNLAIFMLIIYLWYLQYVEEKKANLVVNAYNSIEKLNF